MGRRFLALDQSLSSCGFALWDEGDPLPRSGAWPLCDGRGANRSKAFIGLHREIGAIHREKPISRIACEMPLKLGRDKVPKLIGLYGLVAHIESYAEIRLIAMHPLVAARSWRSTFLGAHGVEGDPAHLKRLAVEKCRHFGMDPETDDEAEAIGIMDHMLHQLRIMPPWRAAQPLFT